MEVADFISHHQVRFASSHKDERGYHNVASKSRVIVTGCVSENARTLWGNRLSTLLFEHDTVVSREPRRQEGPQLIKYKSQN